ncbi:amidohydrolase family protein [Paractinoplanes durhamensis]|uniref:Amidohydrolase n=1 Tax=Paractinoplanes durhamensis TaxID=113563 RepID=A0ABQ3ZAA5_9ACTN|nr:amidohydrolase family protein [Actinoplanes durhamensis]GIE06757.1 amidohydrolase [Actinoplanes durhamensis]
MIDEEVPDFWRALGLPGLADVHTHFLPPRMERRVWDHFAAAGPLIGREWPIRYKSDLSERIKTLDRLGVRIFSALAYAHKPDMAADLNRWSLDFAATTPGCLASATFFPEPSAVEYTRAALDRGAQIVKLHLQVGGFDPRDPQLDEVWGLLAETGTPIVVHAGSGPVAHGFVGPAPIGEVLQRHPGLAIIVAHMGAPEYQGFFDLATSYERVRLDTTMAFTDFFEEMAPFPAGLRPRLHDLGLAGKVLLGSDFPNIPYAYAHQLESLARLDLGDDWLRAVLWHNARDLFGTTPRG